MGLQIFDTQLCQQVSDVFRFFWQDDDLYTLKVSNSVKSLRTT